jgi:Mg-chelatase subunit ChlD
VAAQRTPAVERDGGDMTVTHPWVPLLFIPAALLVWAVARRGHRVVPVGQQRAAVIVRTFAVALLVLALSQPVLVAGSDDRSVVFLVDRSASITAGIVAAQDAYLAEAVDASRPGDRTAVAVFGRDVRLDRALTEAAVVDPIRTVVGTDATDLASALRSTAAVLPTEGSRRIVVLTDGVETVGSARSVVGDLAGAGIAVDTVVFEGGLSSDAQIASVHAPAVAHEGDDVPVQVEVRATRAGPATVTVDAGGEEQTVDVDLAVGSNQVEVTIPTVDTGVLDVDVTVEAGFDAVIENDRGQALVHVLGPAQVAVVEGKQGEGDDMARALAAGGLGVDVITAIPSAEDLLLYDAVVLVNVPAPPDEVAVDLAAFVEDLGRGLVVVGGDQSYGLGGYQDSALEEILPVTSDPDDLIRRQPVAEVLVIDTSGSMAACHCDGISEHDPSMEGGVNKTDISRAGAGLAIDVLEDTDRVGVLAFTSGTRWALPLDLKPDSSVTAQALASLTPAGDTEISPALREALGALQDAPEEIKHMVLFTDGWGDDPDLLSVAEEIAGAGITLSVVGTGEGSGEQLRRAAALGGGRFYAGQDLDTVPEIFAEETLRVARPLVAEGSFLPALGAASPVTSGLTAAPPLRGYILARSKPTSAVVLEVGPGDPLLASWQRGLGRATAWTSDATSRWSADWAAWDGFVDFWGKVVGDVLPAGRETPPEVRLDGGSLRVAYAADVPLDAVAVAHVRDAAGEVTAVPMQRVTEDRFEVSVPMPQTGAYWVAVRVESPDGLVASGSSGVVASYPDEFAFRSPDPTLAADLADGTGGRVDPEPGVAYEAAPQRGDAGVPLWPWLTALAMALFLVDVALRRLVISRGDLTEWKRAVIPTASQPVTAVAKPPLDAPPEARPTREILPEEETLAHLLRRKRQ